MSTQTFSSPPTRSRKMRDQAKGPGGHRIEMKRKGTSEISSFYQRVKNIIKKIPTGKVSTYGQIAALAGNPRAARQVAWILHSSTRKDRLPWHRVVNGKGQISLKPNYGYEIQTELLRKEGVKFGKNDTIDFELYLWSPSYSLKSRRSGARGS